MGAPVRDPDRRPVPARAAASDNARPVLVSCAALAGESVVDARGDELARLEHVLIDARAGRVAYGVIARGGVLGIGERLFAVPWGAFRADSVRRCLVLDVEPRHFDRARGFDRDRWPAMDRAWATAQHDEFGVLPYWARDRA